MNESNEPPAFDVKAWTQKQAIDPSLWTDPAFGVDQEKLAELKVQFSRKQEDHEECRRLMHLYDRRFGVLKDELLALEWEYQRHGGKLRDLYQP